MRYLTLILSFIFTSVLFGQKAGSLDSTYGNEGISSVELNDNVLNILVECFAMAIQEDGKKIISGYKLTNDIGQPVLIRLDIDGKIDSTFGVNGEVKYDDTLSKGAVFNDVKLQDDGKILVIGCLNKELNPNSTIILRYNSEGDPDLDFGQNGLVNYKWVDSIDHCGALSIAFTKTNQILIGGNYSQKNISVNYYYSILCLNQTGIVDSTFGKNGFAVIKFGNNYDVQYLANIGIQSDGKILCAGSVTDNWNREYIGLCRLNPDGQLDNSFGDEGIILHRNVKDYYLSAIYNMEILNTDEILVGSTIDLFDKNYNQIGRKIGCQKYSREGIQDNTFGQNGYVILDVDNKYLSIRGITKALDENNIILGGRVIENYSEPEAKYYFGLTKMDMSGRIDSSFGEKGIVITEIPSPVCLQGIEVQKDKKIVTMGASYTLTEDIFKKEYIITARYLSGLEIGTLDFGASLETMIYPNPVRSKATLKYTLKNRENISIYLTDMLGRRTRTWVNMEKEEAGDHEISLDLGTDLADGIYFIQINNGKSNYTIKIVKTE